MDLVTLVPLALSFIMPYAKKLAGKLAEKSLEALPDMVGTIWDTVKEKMEELPATSTLPADLVAAPEKPAVQGAFEYQLTKLLENDEAFAKQLEELVKQAQKQGISYTAAQKGDGAIAQGDGAKAVGAGGIMIEGGISGSNNIVGHGNTSDYDEKKKKK